jgi:membrane protein
MVERLRALGERWPWLGTALAVNERYGELNGNAAAAAITLMAFLSLIPLIIVAISVVGFVSANGKDVAQNIIDHLGLTGDAAKQMDQAVQGAESSRKATSVIGFLGLIWSALGVTAALSIGVKLPWQQMPKGIKERFLGLAWGAGALVLFFLSVAANSLVDYVPSFVPSWVTGVLALLLGLVTALALMLWTLWLLGERSVGVRSLLPGAVFAAIGYEILTLASAIVLPHLLQSSAAVGLLGVVIVILTWLLFFGKLIVYAGTLNAVLYERREGTVNLQVKAPRLPSQVPVEANRGGVVVDREADEVPETA